MSCVTGLSYLTIWFKHLVCIEFHGVLTRQPLQGLVNAKPDILVLASTFPICGVVPGKWNWISEPRELRSDFRPDEIVVIDWFTCIIGASVHSRILYVLSLKL